MERAARSGPAGCAERGAAGRTRRPPGRRRRLRNWGAGDSHFTIGLGAGLVSASVGWARHLPYLPLRMDDAGLRFGLRKPVPWRDVLTLEWAGPTAADPDTKAGLVFRLRNRRGIRIDLDSVLAPPEAIVRTAEAYTGRRDLLQ